MKTKPTAIFNALLILSALFFSTAALSDPIVIGDPPRVVVMAEGNVLVYADDNTPLEDDDAEGLTEAMKAKGIDPTLAASFPEPDETKIDFKTITQAQADALDPEMKAAYRRFQEDAAELERIKNPDAMTPTKIGKLFEEIQKNMSKNISATMPDGDLVESKINIEEIELQTSSQILGSDTGSFLGKCEMLLPDGTTWKKVTDKAKSGAKEARITAFFTASYGEVTRHLLEDLNNGQEKATNRSVADILEDGLNDAYRRARMIQECTALVYLTLRVDYSDAKASSVEGVDNIKRSFDQKIVAKKNGVETQDFPACSKAIDKYNAAFIGGQALQIGQSFQFQEASMDASITAQENANDITSGMKAQQDMTDEQAKITTTRAAFSGAKGAAMGLALSQIPTLKELVTDCQAKVSGSNISPASIPYEAFKTTIRNAISTANVGITLTRGSASEIGSEDASERRTVKFNLVTTDSKGQVVTNADDNKVMTITADVLQGDPNKKACSRVATEREVSLAMNEVSCRQKIKKAMVEAGVEMASNMLKTKLLNDQSDMIGDAINNVKKFDEDNAAPTFEEFNAEICQADPTLPECATVGPVFDRGREFNGNGINVSGFSRQNTSAGIQREDSRDSVIDSESKNERGEGVTGVGTTVGTPGNSTAFIDPSPGAGSMKRGGGGGAGGGGGGGVGKAASSGGGGGGSGGGGSRGGGGVTGRKINYSGGGGGLSFGGGGKSRSKRSSKKGGNPFSKFFKNKKGGKKGGTLNFRGVASVGGKKDSLFGMISNRYGKLKDERLIKYKAGK